MKSLGTLQVQNKVFNLHIIQILYKVRQGNPEQILKHGDTVTHREGRDHFKYQHVLRH